MYIHVHTRSTLSHVQSSPMLLHKQAGALQARLILGGRHLQSVGVVGAIA
jgi:hypothetical protein